VAQDRWAFGHPADGGSKIVGRHGSLTPAETLVPLLVHVS